MCLPATWNQNGTAKEEYIWVIKKSITLNLCVEQTGLETCKSHVEHVCAEHWTGFVGHVGLTDSICNPWWGKIKSRQTRQAAAKKMKKTKQKRKG